MFGRSLPLAIGLLAGHMAADATSAQGNLADPPLRGARDQEWNGHGDLARASLTPQNTRPENDVRQDAANAALEPLPVKPGFVDQLQQFCLNNQNSLLLPLLVFTSVGIGIALGRRGKQSAKLLLLDPEEGFELAQCLRRSTGSLAEIAHCFSRDEHIGFFLQFVAKEEFAKQQRSNRESGINVAVKAAVNELVDGMDSFIESVRMRAFGAEVRGNRLSIEPWTRKNWQGKQIILGWRIAELPMDQG